jgi:hypothetical protein
VKCYLLLVDAANNMADLCCCTTEHAEIALFISISRYDDVVKMARAGRMVASLWSSYHNTLTITQFTLHFQLDLEL